MNHSTLFRPIVASGVHSACSPKKMSTSSGDSMIEWRLNHTIQQPKSATANSIDPLVPNFGGVWPIYDVNLCGIPPARDSRVSTPVQIPKQVRSKKKSTDGSCPLDRYAYPGGDRYFHYSTRIRKEIWINSALEIIFLAKRKSNNEHSAMAINTAFYDEVHSDLCRSHFDEEYDLHFAHVPDYASNPWPSPFPLPEEEKESTFVPCTHCGNRTLFVGLSRDLSSPPDEAAVVNTVPFFDYLDAVFVKVSLWWNSDAELIQHKETGLDIASKMQHEVASMNNQELEMFLEQAHPTQSEEYNFIDEMSFNSEYRAFMTNEEETNELFFMDTNYTRE